MNAPKKSSPKSIALPDATKLPTSHAELLKLREELKARGAAARKTKDRSAAKAIRALARKVRKLERATRPGAKKSAAKKPAAKKGPSKEEHLRKAA